MEFEKLHVARASVDTAGDMLVYAAFMAVCGWRTSVGDMLLLLLLLKCYPEEKLLNDYF